MLDFISITAFLARYFITARPYSVFITIFLINK